MTRAPALVRTVRSAPPARRWAAFCRLCVPARSMGTIEGTYVGSGCSQPDAFDIAVVHVAQAHPSWRPTHRIPLRVPDGLVTLTMQSPDGQRFRLTYADRALAEQRAAGLMERGWTRELP